ncbi:hypothetical protein EYC59_02170 [Candidatus Saccharibacteria bacterium]|nr:MAG: hypothetical protein EYC59_02170 [Candidatus Saccharibacteria bacterium]
MSENTAANDYALAKILNEHLIQIFALLDNQWDLPDYTALNRSYVLLANEVRQIYARQPKLQKAGGTICWQVMKNIELFHENIGEYKTLAYEYTHSGADYGEEHNSNVNMLCIEANVDKPIISPRIKKLLTEAESNIKAFQYELDKMNAKLSFDKITIPVISIGDSTYHLTSMRYGITFDIISYCYDNFPNEYVGLTTINKYLQLEELGKPNIKNLRDKMRGSHFEDEGPLVPFIEISPRKIMIKKSATLTDEQVNKIKAVSKHSNSD